MAVDKARKDRHHSPVDPADRGGPLPSPQIIVLADLRDSAVFHDDGAIPPAAKGTEIRGVNEESADSKWAGVWWHDGAISYQEWTEW